MLDSLGWMLVNKLHSLGITVGSSTEIFFFFFKMIFMDLSELVSSIHDHFSMSFYKMFLFVLFKRIQQGDYDTTASPKPN